MSLRYAILTGLNERSATGIELARRFDRSIGYFWPASHQQIYRDLDRLAADGLVAEVTEDGPPRPGQPRRFEITGAGRDALTAWVGETDEPTKLRDALLVRVRAAAAVGPEAVGEVVEHHLLRHEAALATYRGIEARDFPSAQETNRSDSDRLLHLVLRRGIEVEQAWVTWCREVLAVTGSSSGEDTPAPDPRAIGDPGDGREAEPPDPGAGPA